METKKTQETGARVEVKNLTKKFGDLLVLDDISFNVEKGEFLCIVGPTGCGKTTFLNSLTKLYDLTAGEILVNGESVDPKTVSYTHLLRMQLTDFLYGFLIDLMQFFHCVVPRLKVTFLFSLRRFDFFPFYRLSFLSVDGKPSNRDSVKDRFALSAFLSLIHISYLLGGQVNFTCPPAC